MDTQPQIPIDLPRRRERRFVIPSVDEFLALLAPHVERVFFSSNEYVETLYFNNDHHQIPFDMSLRARRYLPAVGPPTLDDTAEYFWEVKMGSERMKAKHRTLDRLANIVGHLNVEQLSTDPLRPYVATTYHRRHYISPTMAGMRVTVDDDIRYYYFPPGAKTAVPIGAPDQPRVEIKEREDLVGLWPRIEALLVRVQALPTISKRYRTYHYLRQHRLRQLQRPFERTAAGCEFEAKLTAPSGDLFVELRAAAAADELAGFVIAPDFPWSTESASINRYYRDAVGEFKAILRGGTARVVWKGAAQVLPGLPPDVTVLKRRETKQEVVGAWGEPMRSAQLLGEINRKKKSFWVQEPSGTRLYRINLDYSQGFTFTDVLFQVELEYGGRWLPSAPAAEATITQELTALVAAVRRRFPQLVPTPTTKWDWLREVGSVPGNPKP